MKYISILILLGLPLNIFSQLQPGDPAPAFTLLNVDGEKVSLSDYSGSKGVVLVFTCNGCPFSKAYEKRLVELHKQHAPYGYQVIAINPNNDKASPDDTIEQMKKRSETMHFPFVYLKDNYQEISNAYGAKRTPEVFVLQNKGNGNFQIVYTGSIDDNVVDENTVSLEYVKKILKEIETGEEPIPPNPKVTQAIGCTIKTKK